MIRGAVSYSNASVTVIPTGSGNDFIRCFSDPDAFRDLKRLRCCDEASFDLIRAGSDWAINVCSIGFDARVGTEISRYKRLPFLTGSGAYVPVSYTHLDVYKRQGVGGATCVSHQSRRR